MQHIRATTLATLTSAVFSAHCLASGVGMFPVQREESVLRTYDLRVHVAMPGPSANPMSRNTGVRLFVLAPSAGGAGGAGGGNAHGGLGSIAPTRAEYTPERTTTPAGESLLWTIPRLAEPATVSATIRASASPITLEDQAARAIPWPIRGWPEHVADALRDNATRDADDPRVRKLIERWVGAQNRSVTPVTLAKYLAARTLTHAPASLTPMILDDANGRTVGIASEGAGRFADRAGSEFDMLRFYATALRSANIPARLVVGVRDEGEHAARPHAWVEFFVYDERVRRGEWVPVDLVSQRALDPNPPALNKPWKHFGADRDGTLVPLAFGCPPATREPGILATWWVESDAPARTPVASVTIQRTQNPAHAAAKTSSRLPSAN